MFYFIKSTIKFESLNLDKILSIYCLPATMPNPEPDNGNMYIIHTASGTITTQDLSAVACATGCILFNHCQNCLNP